jgi:hypothetical protein
MSKKFAAARKYAEIEPPSQEIGKKKQGKAITKLRDVLRRGKV